MRKPKLPLPLVYNVDFEDDKKRASFISNMDGFDRLLKLARSRTASHQSMCGMPVLKKMEEQYLFRQYNAIKFQANLSLTKFKTHAKLMTHLQEVKDVIVMCNVRLCSNFVKKRGYDAKLFQCKFSDAKHDMIRAVDLFDYSRGFKFSTYCCWCLIKNFSRVSADEKQNNKTMFMDPTDFMNNYDPAAPVEANNATMSNDQRLSINKLFRAANLTEREIHIIMENTGLDGEKKILEDIGNTLGITKERTRQIKEGAIRKLRGVLEDNYQLLEVS